MLKLEQVVKKFAESVIGTCDSDWEHWNSFIEWEFGPEGSWANEKLDSIEDFDEDVNNLPEELYATISNITSRCNRCSWWVGVEELNYSETLQEDVCSNCWDDEEHEEHGED